MFTVSFKTVICGKMWGYFSFLFFLYAFIKQNYVFKQKTFPSKKLHSPTQRITVSKNCHMALFLLA